MITHEQLDFSEYSPHPPVSSDIPSLVKLENAAFPEPDRWSEEAITKEVALEPPRFRVVKEAGQVIAYVHTQMGYGDEDGPETDGLIGSIAVAPSRRRRGLGEHLLRGGIYCLEKQQAQRIIARMRADNAASIALHKKVGFEEMDRIAGFYGESGDALAMQLKEENPPEYLSQYMSIRLVIKHLQHKLGRLPFQVASRNLPQSILETSKAHILKELAYLSTFPQDMTLYELHMRHNIASDRANNEISPRRD